MKFREMVRMFRLKKGLTQETLGERLGVSAQAVSKWENTDTYPDAGLLVPLANELEVSLDILFRNGRITERDASLMIADVVAHTDREERFKLCRRFGWQMEAAMFGVVVPESECGPAGDPADERGMSAIADGNGFTQISNRPDAPYFAVFPKPQDGWAGAIGDGERIRKVFAALGHRPTMKAVLFLLRQESGFLFDAGYLADRAGIEAGEADAVLEDLTLLGLAWRPETVEIDGAARRIWRYRPNEKLVSLLIFARDEGYFDYYRLQSQNHTVPLL